MASKIFLLKKKVLQEIPQGELPWKILGRLMIKTGFSWGMIKENEEISQDKYEKALIAVKEIFGKNL